MKLFIARAAGACLLSMAALQPASAQPEDLTLQQAIRLALQKNPELQASSFALQAASARTHQAALAPPLEARLDVEDVAGSGRVRGVQAGQFTLALSQVIELGGKRQARIAASSTEADTKTLEHQARQLDVLSEVQRRYLHVVSDQAQLALTRQASELAQDTVRATEQRLAAAKAPEVELRRARVALTRAALEEEHAEHELLSSRRNLAALWGDTEPAFGEATADLYQLPEPETFEALQARLEQNPDSLRLLSESRLREAELRLAQSRARPDLGLSLGLRRLQETRDQALVLGVSLPLFTPGRAAGAVVEAQSLQDESEAQRRAQTVQAQAKLFELYQELRHALAEAKTLRDQVLPELNSALDATRQAYTRGRYGYLEWVEAQRELISARRGLIDAARNTHLYRAEIERLTASPLPDTTP